MNITEAKAKLVAWCNAQLGYAEGADNWNKYAEDLRLQQLYGWNAQNQPWCDLFTDEAFVECFGLTAAAAMTYQPIGAGSAACRYSAQFFKNAGAFYSTPEPGDVIFFYYDGAINHQGIVVSVGNGLVATVEGNSSDMVTRRTYSLGDGSIAGYGRPNWGVFEGGEPSTPTTGTDDPPAENTVKPRVDGLPMLKKGDTGEVVRAAQFLLNGRKCSVGIWGADGDFGNGTRAAVLAFQRRNDLEADGIIGPQTWAALLGV